jgi:hypothetical protein
LRAANATWLTFMFISREDICLGCDPGVQAAMVRKAIVSRSLKHQVGVEVDKRWFGPSKVLRSVVIIS